MSIDNDQTLRAHPAFVTFRQVLPLNGFSGAAVALVRSAGGAQFVRKAAVTDGANTILMAQAARQRVLRAQLAGVAGVPQILDDGEINGFYYFDMEFVPSLDANSFLGTASFGDLRVFAGRIEGLLRHLSELERPELPPLTIEPLLQKIDEIDSRTNGQFAHLLEPLRCTATALEVYSRGGCATAVHGDLTFENIFVGSQNRLWLIDPIQSPLDHYWFDWAKLFQECEGHWYLHRGRRLSAGVMLWLRNRWFATASAIAPDYARWHWLLLALTFARILPYARTPLDVEFLTARVATFGEAALRLARG